MTTAPYTVVEAPPDSTWGWEVHHNGQAVAWYLTEHGHFARYYADQYNKLDERTTP